MKTVILKFAISKLYGNGKIQNDTENCMKSEVLKVASKKISKSKATGHGGPCQSHIF
jgi:hypothetical protein